MVIKFEFILGANTKATMFKAHLKEAAILKKVVDAIKDFVNDANFLCTGDGLQMQAMDSSHVVLVCLTLLAEGFTEYECPEDFSLGLSLSLLSKILKCAENSDSILLEAEPAGDMLHITFESVNGSRKSSFEVARMNIDTDSIQIPETEYQCSVKLPYSTFKKVTSDLSSLGDTCSIQVQTGIVTFNVRGEIGGTATFTLNEDKTCKKVEEQTIIDMDDEDRNITLRFALRYLSNFAKTNGLSEQVGIFMRDGFPLYVTYDLGDIGSVGYHLAPKIDED